MCLCAGRGRRGNGAQVAVQDGRTGVCLCVCVDVIGVCVRVFYRYESESLGGWVGVCLGAGRGRRGKGAQVAVQDGRTGVCVIGIPTCVGLHVRESVCILLTWCFVLDNKGILCLQQFIIKLQ